jgi:hypothetical protein
LLFVYFQEWFQPNLKFDAVIVLSAPDVCSLDTDANTAHAWYMRFTITQLTFTVALCVCV